jgi:hypothetical protein
MNCITTDGNYQFSIDQRVKCHIGAYHARVKWLSGKWQVKHRYTERFERNVVAEINMYVIWCQTTNQCMTVSEVVLRAA